MEVQIIEDKKLTGFNRSIWFLVFSNLVTASYAIYIGANLGLIMLVYWSQSVSIGIVNFIRMLQLKNFSTKNLRINGRLAEPTKDTKNFVAFFFLVHYGLFHFAYFVFIYTQHLKNGLIDSRGVWFVIISSLMFFANHLYSYFYNREADRKKTSNIGRVMVFPYARIIPMHLTIIIGSDIKAIALPLFLLLKTGADAVMHYWEHK